MAVVAVSVGVTLGAGGENAATVKDSSSATDNAGKSKR